MLILQHWPVKRIKYALCRCFLIQIVLRPIVSHTLLGLPSQSRRGQWSPIFATFNSWPVLSWLRMFIWSLDIWQLGHIRISGILRQFCILLLNRPLRLLEVWINKVLRIFLLIDWWVQSHFASHFQGKCSISYFRFLSLFLLNRNSLLRISIGNLFFARFLRESFNWALHFLLQECSS